MNKFELRRLCADDIFPLCDIISKCGINEFRKCFEKVSEKNSDSRIIGISITFELVGIICKNLSSCKNMIYSFLASVSGISEKDIGCMKPAEFTALVNAVLTKKEMKDFFTAASELFLSVF